MKKVLMCSVALFLTGLLLCNASFAARIDNDAIAKKCATVAIKIYELSQTKGDDECALKVYIAGNYMEIAGRMIRTGDDESGWFYLRKAERYLKTVQQEINYCAYFSPLVKPFLDEVMNLRRKLETNPWVK